MTDWVKYFTQQMIARGAIASEDDLERLEVGTPPEGAYPLLTVAEYDVLADVTYESQICTFKNDRKTSITFGREVYGNKEVYRIVTGRRTLGLSTSIGTEVDIVLCQDGINIINGSIDTYFPAEIGHRILTTILGPERTATKLQEHIKTPQQAVDFCIGLYLKYSPNTVTYEA